MGFSRQEYWSGVPLPSPNQGLGLSVCLEQNQDHTLHCFLIKISSPSLSHWLSPMKMATHSSILAWRILWMEEPGGLLSMGSHRAGHDRSNLACMHALEKEMATHSSILAWRNPGTEEPDGLPSMGSHRVRHDWSDLAAAAASFFLQLFLHWSPLAYWVPTDLGSSSLGLLYFCLFILFMGLSRQEYWSGLPFPSPVDHILSEFSTMTYPSWVALYGRAHSFIELAKAVVHVISLISFPWLWFPFCLSSDGEG